MCICYLFVYLFRGLLRFSPVDARETCAGPASRGSSHRWTVTCMLPFSANSIRCHLISPALARYVLRQGSFCARQQWLGCMLGWRRHFPDDALGRFQAALIVSAELCEFSSPWDLEALCWWPAVRVLLSEVAMMSCDAGRRLMQRMAWYGRCL